MVNKPTALSVLAIEMQVRLTFNVESSTMAERLGLASGEDRRWNLGERISVDRVATEGSPGGMASWW